ncbi:MAG TPA: hypothetical protein DCR48_04010 [Flavobacteriales bacterium]|nr:hypothetical protein [Flavobacteriales bacterium]
MLMVLKRMERTIKFFITKRFWLLIGLNYLAICYKVFTITTYSTTYHKSFTTNLNPIDSSFT